MEQEQQDIAMFEELASRIEALIDSLPPTEEPESAKLRDELERMHDLTQSAITRLTDAMRLARMTDKELDAFIEDRREGVFEADEPDSARAYADDLVRAMELRDQRHMEAAAA